MAVLLAALGGAGALGGIHASQSAIPSVDSVLSATAVAGTARFVSASVSLSTNPLLRSRSTTTAEVNFASGDSSAVTVTHSLNYGSSNGTGKRQGERGTAAITAPVGTVPRGKVVALAITPE